MRPNREPDKTQANQDTSQGRKHLSHRVTTVNDDISTSSISRSIADKVDIRALELLGVAVSRHGDHASPKLLGVVVDEVGQTSVDVAGRDGVDTGEVAPLVGERARHVDAASLGDVVGGLLLREVGDVAGHGGRDDEGAGALLLEVLADGLGAVGSAVEIDLDDMVPVGSRAVDDTSIGGSTSAVEVSIN